MDNELNWKRRNAVGEGRQPLRPGAGAVLFHYTVVGLTALRTPNL
jgi:hypothetical protein